VRKIAPDDRAKSWRLAGRFCTPYEVPPTLLAIADEVIE
jgi:hypothetical protein